MSHRLMLANLRNDAAILDEVAGLLRDLKLAWDGLVAGQQTPAPVVHDVPPAARSAMSYGKV
jgi:flagellar protein FliS